MPSSVNEAGVFSFPQGKRLAKFPLSADELKLTGNPNYVIVKPLANAMLGILDVTKGTIVSGMNKADVTFWNDLMIFELASGSVTISQTKYDEAGKILRIDQRRKDRHSGRFDEPAFTRQTFLTTCSGWQFHRKRAERFGI